MQNREESSANVSSISHYEILGVSRDADAACIKEAYHTALLSVHPDKAPNPGAKATVAYQEDWPNGRKASDVRSLAPEKQQWQSRQFLRVRSAWEVLSNPVTKGAYDRHLAQQNPAASEELDLDDFEQINSPADDRLSCGISSDSLTRHVWRHSCRCGGFFLIEEGDLSDEGNSVAVNCSHCSVLALVLYTIAL